MMMNLLVLAMLGGIGYMWVSRGFFSALLHFGCVLTAGVIAFSIWEPVANLMLGQVDAQWMVDMVWGVSLLLPFALLTAVLTVGMNSLVRANAQCDSVTNVVGGAVCGLGTAVITSGITVISLSMVRAPSDFLDYRPVGFDQQGSVVKTESLWVPVDKITAGLFQHMSDTAMTSGDTLNHWRPNLAMDGHLMRVAPEGNTLKFTLKPKDVGLLGRYTVAENAKEEYRALVGDTKKVLSLEGEDLGRTNNGAFYIEGYVVTFKAGAREKNGQIVIGPGHLQLVMASADGTESYTAQPFAMISQARGDNVAMGRWRFDARDVFIASPGSSTDPLMAFEFMVPKRSDAPWQPVALYVRGVRFDLIDPSSEQPIKPFQKYLSAGERDAAVTSMGLAADAASNVAEMDSGTASRFNAGNIKALDSPIKVTNRLPSIALNKGDIRSIEISDKNAIVGGRSRYNRNSIMKRGDDRSLMVEFFEPGSGTVIVQVNVSPNTEFSLLDGESDAATGAPVIMDDLNQKYEAIGFVYGDQTNVEVAFQPGSPITDKGQLPALSRSRTDQTLWLIFRVNLNVKLKSYAIGNKVIKTIEPPQLLDQPQMVR